MNTLPLHSTAPTRSRRPLAKLCALLVVTAVTAVGTVTGAVGAASATALDRASGSDVVSLVDPFVGTSGDNGNDLPGAQAPNGLAKVNPLTTPGRNHAGYDYRATQIAGFTNTNLDGVGGSGGGGDVLVVPTSVTYASRPDTATYAHDFSHANESASPGSYRVALGALTGTGTAVTKQSSTIDAEVTATTRTALHRYTFPAGLTPSLVFDLRNNFTSRTSSSVAVEHFSDGRVGLNGTFAGSFNGASYAMAYHAETVQPVQTVQTWSDDGALATDVDRSGTGTGAILTFGTAAGSSVELRITLSPISADQARIDQAAEVGSATFDDIRTRTRTEWNTRLSAVDAGATTTSDPDGSLRRLFYTHLYRMLALPVNATSTSGTYRGVDGAVHRADGFTYYDGWSSWDDFRKYSVIAYVDPELYRNLVQSLVFLFADQHAAGAKSLSSLTHGVPTVRWERSAVIIADALSKGYRDLQRLDEAYPAIRDLVGYYTAAQLRQGYISDDPGQSVQRGYDQWALAIIADAVGDADEAASLRSQATMPISSLIKPGAWTAADGTPVGVLTPRDGNGSWTSADYERFEAARLYQGTLWQYHWYDAYDMQGLITAMGGEKATRDALAHMFGEDRADDGSGMLHSNANEIDLQAPYLFNYVGQASKTQKWVRAIYTAETWNRYIATGSTDQAPSANGEFTPPVHTRVYKLDPEGLLPTMDNDAGTMSTMFVAAAIGLFPVTAGSSQYQIGTPFFEKTAIHYRSGRTFTVTADGVSPSSYYVQSATKNGVAFGNTWLDYSDVVSGGSLGFQMGSTASAWGSSSTPAYSLSAAQPDPTPAASVTASPASVPADADGKVAGTATLTLTGARFAAAAGTELGSNGMASVRGLPASVSATVTVTAPNTVDVTVTGTARTGARFWVDFTDGALSGASASSLTGQGVSQADALSIDVAAVDRSALTALVERARLVGGTNYSWASRTAFRATLERARTVLGDPATTGSQVRGAADALTAAIAALTLDGGGFRVLQAEQSDDWSGGSLVRERFQSAGNLGGVTTGSWVGYHGLDFGGKKPLSLSVRYANSVAATAAPSSVQVRTGGADGAVVATLSLPGTGGWGSYATVSTEVSDPDALAASSDVTFVFAAPNGQQWVSNFDWFQFSDRSSTAASSDKRIEAEAWVANSGGGLKSESSTWSDGGVTNLGGTYPRAWLDYGTVDFGSVGMTDVAVHYVTNSNRSGTNARIEFYVDPADPTALSGSPIVTVALPVTGSNWSDAATVKATLTTALSGKHRLVARLLATTDSAHPYVANIDGYTFSRTENVTSLLQAEAWKANSGGSLKAEDSSWSDGGVRNLGGTYDGAWIDYGTLSFGQTPVTDLSVHYVHNSGRCGPNSRIEVFLDPADTSALGTPFATVPLTTTGSNWSTAGTASISLPSSITGDHRIVIRLRSSVDSSHPYVANIDWLRFQTGIDTSTLRATIASASALEGDSAEYPDIDFGVFTRELASARALVTSATVQSAVDEQEQRLRLAARQLVPLERMRLRVALDDAGLLAEDRYTASSWSGLSDARDAARRTADDTAAGDSAWRSARTTLTAAVEALALKPLRAPAAPLGVSAASVSSSITVRWNAPSDEGGSPVTAYVVTLGDARSVTIDDPTQRSAVFTWLPAGTAFTPTVSARNAIGSSASASATPLAAGGAAPVVSTSTGDADTTSNTARAASTPFSSTALQSTYASDSWPATPDGSAYFTYMLRDFATLGGEVKAPNEKLAYPTPVTAANDAKAIEINHAASAAQVKRANTDADNSPRKTMADAFGDRLSGLYLSALTDGRLPKTSALFDRTNSGIDTTDAAKNAYQYQRPYVRLGFVGDGGKMYETPNGSYGGLAGSGSFPSGHTYGGYTNGTLLATLVPELAPQILARSSEYGDNRIVLGFHYPLDVMGSRMTAQATIAHRWADPQFATLLQQAHDEMEQVLTADCIAAGYGTTLTECSGNAYGGMTTQAAVGVYTDRLTYGFPQVNAAGQKVTIPTEAAALLTTTFPNLTDAQRLQVLEKTALDSGYALDSTHEGEASWQRVNLARAMSADVSVGADGSVTVRDGSGQAETDDTAQSVSSAAALTVAGVPLDGFASTDQTYLVDWPASRELPAVSATPSVAGAHVTVSTPTSASPLRRDFAVAPTGADANGVSLVTVTSANGKTSTVYTVRLFRTSDDHLPDSVPSPGTDPGTNPGTSPGTNPGSGGGNGAGQGAGQAPGATSLENGAQHPSALSTSGSSLLATVIALAVAVLLLGSGLVLAWRRRRSS